jgi:uncharacterized protein YggE
MFALPAIVMLISGAPSGAAERTMNENQRTITVSGDAEIKVPPNEVSIALGVESFEKDLSKAKRDADDRVKRIIAAAKAAGIEDKLIATDRISIEPHYSSGSGYSSSRPVNDGYTVRQSLQIRLREIPRFDAVLSAALEAGANVVNGVQFTTTELRKHRDEAREMAMKAATEKATLLARTLGMKPGRARAISEGGGGWWSGYGYWGGGRGGMMAQNVSQNLGGGAAPDGTMAPGLISVTANVSVTFDLE